MQGQSAEREIKVTIVIVPSHFYLLPSRRLTRHATPIAEDKL